LKEGNTVIHKTITVFWRAQNSLMHSLHKLQAREDNFDLQKNITSAIRYKTSLQPACYEFKIMFIRGLLNK